MFSCVRLSGLCRNLAGNLLILLVCSLCLLFVFRLPDDNHSYQAGKISVPPRYIQLTRKSNKQRAANFTGEDVQQLNANVHSRSCQKRLPHVIIIGVPKCGTTALIEFLGIHPDVSAVLSGEVHFFDNHYRNGLDHYRQQMTCSTDNQLTVEKSPQYFLKRTVPPKIHQMNSTVKLLLIVRAPAFRTVSAYLQSKALGRMAARHNFADLVMKNGRVNKKSSLIHNSLYANFLKVWLKYFSMDQIHVVDGDRFAENPLEELKLVESFLGIKPYVSRKDFVYNATKGFYCVKSEANSKLRVCDRPGKGRQHPDEDRDTMNKLRVFFKPHNEDFFRLVGRRFNW